jgi:sortase A
MSTDAHNSFPAFTRPGLHSFNVQRRREAAARRRARRSSFLRLFFLLTGLGGLGYYGYTLGNEYVYQAYQNWAFDQEIAGHHVTYWDWVMQKTPLGAWTGYRAPAPVKSLAARHTVTGAEHPATPPALAEGALMGRVEIPRLNLSAIVRQGVEQSTLSRAVGHVPTTQGPGAVGNFAIAAHRDTLFRALKDIKQGDIVTFQATSGTFDYQVTSTRIVKPTDVSVLRPDGNQKLLTMITCYPFYYVGSAPKRFIVTARLVKQTPVAQP